MHAHPPACTTHMHKERERERERFQELIEFKERIQVVVVLDCWGQTLD